MPTISKANGRTSPVPSKTAWQRVRRALGLAVAVAGVFVVGSRLGGAIPREVSVEITSRASLTEIDLEVSQNGGLIKAIRRPLAGERKIMERFRLAPGDYLLSVAGRGEHDVYEDSQTLRVPASSVVQVSLGAGASP